MFSHSIIIKTVTALGGGLLTTSNSKWEKRARLLASQARLQKPYYQFLEVGYNYRMSPLTAAYGLLQMEQDALSVVNRQRIFANYCKQLATIPGLSWAQELEGHIASRWLSAFRFSKNKSVKELLKSADNQVIETYNWMEPPASDAAFIRFSQGPEWHFREAFQRSTLPAQ